MRIVTLLSDLLKLEKPGRCHPGHLFEDAVETGLGINSCVIGNADEFKVAIGGLVHQ